MAGTGPAAQRAEPSTVGWFLVLYAVIHTGAALWFGEGWFARADGFEVYSTLQGRVSRSDGGTTDAWCSATH